MIFKLRVNYNIICKITSKALMANVSPSKKQRKQIKRAIGKCLKYDRSYISSVMSIMGKLKLLVKS